MFGRTREVLEYWSLDAPGYARDQNVSTELPPRVRTHRDECLVPGTESENGQLWVRTLEAQAAKMSSPWQASSSTLALLRAQAYILSPHAIGLVRIGSEDDLSALDTGRPLSVSHPAVERQWAHQFAPFFRNHPYKTSTIFKECFADQREDDPIYRCDSVYTDTQWITTRMAAGVGWEALPFPEWKCEDPESPNVQEKW
eukprot:6337494-Prymnesium_polylepis.1